MWKAVCRGPIVSENSSFILWVFEQEIGILLFSYFAGWPIGVWILWLYLNKCYNIKAKIRLTVKLRHRLPVLFWLNLSLFVFLFVGEKGCPYFSFFLGRGCFIPKFLLQGTSLWWITLFSQSSSTPLLPLPPTRHPLLLCSSSERGRLPMSINKAWHIRWR